VDIERKEVVYYPFKQNNVSKIGSVSDIKCEGK